MSQYRGKAQMIRRMDLLQISTNALIKYLTDMEVPHKANWAEYSREELIEKLSNYVFQGKFD